DTNFVRRMKPTDLAQVIDFDSRVSIRQTFTSNQDDLETAIKSTVSGGSTSLHNAIYISLKELAKIKAASDEDVRRQALVVFSDGEDTSSLVSFDEVLDLAKRSETAIYTIARRGPRRAITPQRVERFTPRSVRRRRRRVCHSFRAPAPTGGAHCHHAPDLRRAHAHLRHRHADDGGAARAVCEPVTGDFDVRVA